MSDSELGRKGSDLAQKTVERVSEQAEELRKTDVGQAVQKVCTPCHGVCELTLPAPTSPFREPVL